MVVTNREISIDILPHSIQAPAASQSLASEQLAGSVMGGLVTECLECRGVYREVSIKASTEFIKEERVPLIVNPEEADRKEKSTKRLEMYDEPQPVQLVEGQRIFGEDEIIGGAVHSFEHCKNPEDCQFHKDEYLRRNPTTSLTQKIKEGFQSLKDKFLGYVEGEENEISAPAEEAKPMKFEEHQITSEMEEIPEESAVGKNLPKPDKGFIVSHSAHKKPSDQMHIQQPVQIVQEVESENIVFYDLPPIYSKPEHVEKQVHFQEVPSQVIYESKAEIPEQCETCRIESQISQQPETQINIEAPLSQVNEPLLISAPLISQPIQQPIQQIITPQISPEVYQQPLMLQQPTTNIMQQQYVTAPQTAGAGQVTEIVLPVHTYKHRPKVNPKDIAETELYQENYPGERVHEGGSLSGMPLDHLNRPVAMAQTINVQAPQPITTQRQVNKVYTTTTETESGDHTERVIVQTQNVRPEMIQEQYMPSIPPAPMAQPSHRTDIEGFGHHEDRVEVEQYAGTATSLPTYQSAQVSSPYTQTYATTTAAPLMAQQISAPLTTHYETLPMTQQQTQYVQAAPVQQYQTYSAAPMTTTYAQQPNFVTQQVTQGRILPGQSVQEEKLPFGGTKPGQYMAQEVPVLYGWGAAPSQRIYKSNEVVGINYANEVVQHKGHHLHVTHGAPVYSNEPPKLERQYQGEVNEGNIRGTANKIFRNVNEPIDSRVVEHKQQQQPERMSQNNNNRQKCEDDYDQVFAGQCAMEQKQLEDKKSAYRNIIDCFKLHKKSKRDKESETGFQFGAPCDQKTNDMLEEIDEKLRQEEELEGQCRDETIIKRIEISSARDYEGPTKIDS